MKKTIDGKIEMKVFGSDGSWNCPSCPKCGNGNAMLEKRQWIEEINNYDEIYYCRDCGYEIDFEFVELVFMNLDKKGMGDLSTYTEVRRQRHFE